VDAADLAAVHRRSHRVFFERLGAGGSPGSQWRSWGDVGAAIVPVTPDRSLPNSVVYQRPEAVLEHYDMIAQAYADAGVGAFTVWVEPGDEALLVPELARRGHVRDTAPLLQAAALADLDLPALAGAPLDLVPEPTFAELGRLNDLAWGLPTGTLAAAVSGLDGHPGEAIVRTAVHDGEPACTLCVFVVGTDAYVTLVATLPQARGQGLATRLLAHTLLEARVDGAVTTTLEASTDGAPVYERMGYRSLWRLGMYERRVAAA
jgi:GNAT superfamily N-acetyltransferase